MDFGPPERGDVIVFRYPEDEHKDFIKRIIGVPGDNIQIRNKIVYVNGEPFQDATFTQRVDPGIIDGRINPRDNYGPVTVPPHSYFVMATTATRAWTVASGATSRSIKSKAGRFSCIGRGTVRVVDGMGSLESNRENHRLIPTEFIGVVRSSTRQPASPRSRTRRSDTSSISPASLERYLRRFSRGRVLILETS